MKVELLYPEVCNLYGELFNIEYLRRSVPECGVASTSLGETPRFLTDSTIDLVYMGTMTERSQLIVVEELNNYREGIWRAIERGQRFLITGNALEIFGIGIDERSDMMVSEIGGEGIDCLGLFDFTVERDMLHRKNSLFLGEYMINEKEAIEIVGYQSQFTHAIYGPQAPEPLFRVVRGPSFGNGYMREGLHYKNFMATYTIGPLLVLNPAFLVRLCWEMGVKGIAPPHMEAAMDAYKKRLSEYSDPDRGFEY